VGKMSEIKINEITGFFTCLPRSSLGFFWQGAANAKIRKAEPNPHQDLTDDAVRLLLISRIL